MLSTLIFITLMPLQISPGGHAPVPISKPLAVAAFVDSARIIGLPRLKLRDAKGNLYFPHKAMLQEPAAIIRQHAGMSMASDVSARKAYINSYVRR